jgi:hypothetical protein
MGKMKKTKLSVKSGRHEFSLSSLTMNGQSEEKNSLPDFTDNFFFFILPISELRENSCLPDFTDNFFFFTLPISELRENSCLPDFTDNLFFFTLPISEQREMYGQSEENKKKICKVRET